MPVERQGKKERHSERAFLRQFNLKYSCKCKYKLINAHSVVLMRYNIHRHKFLYKSFG